MTRESRPCDRAAAISTTPKSEVRVTRLEVEALLDTLGADPWPGWYAHPITEAEFAASVIEHCRRRGRRVMPVYDAADVLVAYRGIRLRRAG